MGMTIVDSQLHVLRYLFYCFVVVKHMDNTLDIIYMFYMYRSMLIMHVASDVVCMFRAIAQHLDKTKRSKQNKQNNSTSNTGKLSSACRSWSCSFGISATDV